MCLHKCFDISEFKPKKDIHILYNITSNTACIRVGKTHLPSQITLTRFSATIGRVWNYLVDDVHSIKIRKNIMK